jgi:hypothetical protein
MDPVDRRDRMATNYSFIQEKWDADKLYCHLLELT